MLEIRDYFSKYHTYLDNVHRSNVAACSVSARATCINRCRGIKTAVAFPEFQWPACGPSQSKGTCEVDAEQDKPLTSLQLPTIRS